MIWFEVFIGERGTGDGDGDGGVIQSLFSTKSSSSNEVVSPDCGPVRTCVL